MPRTNRDGSTLIELLVVLVVLAIAAGIAGLAMNTTGTVADSADWRTALARARAEAIAHGVPVRTRVFLTDSVVHALTALPDGSVIVPPELGINRFTGRTAASGGPP